jgi:Protein of unknown function (DUF1236)
MRTKQQTLLAGVAALALFAASGIASAQQTQQDQKGGAAQSSSMQSQRDQQGAKNQSANQGMRNQGALQSKNQNAMSKQSSGQNAQNESKMQSGQRNAGKMSNAGKGEKSFNRSAQQQNKGAANQAAQGQQRQLNAQSKTQSKTEQTRTGQFATQQGNKTQRGTNTAQRNEQLKGLQGSTRAPMQGATSTEQRGGGAANVSLNDQQRTQIRDTVINARSAPRVSNVDFNVNVGTVVPRGRIHMVAVPQTLFRIQPRWRHYMYFVFNNEIVIVDPRSMRIVDVLPV